MTAIEAPANTQTGIEGREKSAYTSRAEFKKELKARVKLRDKNIRLVLRDFAKCEVLPGWWPDFLVPIRTKITIGMSVYGTYYGSVEWRMLGFNVKWRCHTHDFSSQDTEAYDSMWWGLIYELGFNQDIRKLTAALNRLEESSTKVN